MGCYGVLASVDTMKLLLKDFNSGQQLEKVIIHSLDGSLYQASALVDGAELLIWITEREPLRTRNLIAMKEAFAHLRVDQLVMRQDSAYDEMVGQPLKPESNRLEIPLSVEPYPFN